MGRFAVMKVALVYDRVNRAGGAERVLEVLHELWPDAPLFTAVYDPEAAPWAAGFEVKTSFLRRFPLAARHHELYAWLTPLAFESFDFRGFDLVISVTSAEAKAVITKPGTTHVCYCLTPPRYLWQEAAAHFGEYRFKFPLLEPLTRRLGPGFSSPLRVWDQVAAQRPDYYLAISESVRKRIRKYYRREAGVVYPPVAVESFRRRPETGQKIQKVRGGDYFLLVSRLVPYKRVEVAVEAFNRLGLSLVIVGEGSEMGRLKKMARENVIFTGRLTDEELVGYYQGCRAFVFPGREDFGMVVVEAQAAGKPVIAYRGGGALETVVEGKTGIFFDSQTAPALIKAVAGFDPRAYPAEACFENAAKFSRERFKKLFREEIDKFMEKPQRQTR
jgi:glycosyltransferase involved in cell wall biosynthesis